tara:strand:- start:1198 stop:1509 length:312 start_codon:yes stop_codon:yes gene_type:complete
MINLKTETMKVIKMNTPDGQYTLPLVKVAEHRASKYENKVKNPIRFQEEIEFVMVDDFEGIDWIVNNTNYEDWEDETTKLNSDVKVTMDDFWCSSEDFEIVEM